MNKDEILNIVKNLLEDIKKPNSLLAIKSFKSNLKRML